jgi:hypothetical protein
LSTIIWELPVPSTSLLGSGPMFEMRAGRELAIRFAYELEETSVGEVLVLQGVEAFKCTYYLARDASIREGYDRLVDRGQTNWLAEVCGSLRCNGGEPSGLVHMMINFDDGPCYEFLCRSFRVERQWNIP